MNIYITLDYELFLGKVTGTPENCLVKPMNDLCSVADKYNAKFIIFVDAAYLLRLNQLKNVFDKIGKDYDLVTSHIISLKNAGHDIQLHFHPQWLYSEWDNVNNCWKIDTKHYKLSDMEEQFAFNSFRVAKCLLDNIIEEKTYAFRAGGYSLETFNNYYNLFIDNGIVIDSSVNRNSRLITSLHNYDYTNIPDNQVYRFENSVQKENKTGRFIELSISSVIWNPLYYLLFIRPKIFNYYPKVIYKDGVAIGEGTKENRFRKLFNNKVFQASIDGKMSNVLDIVYEVALRKGQKELILIGHPKNTSNVSIKNFDDFLKACTIDDNKIHTTRNLFI